MAAVEDRVVGLLKPPLEAQCCRSAAGTLEAATTRMLVILRVAAAGLVQSATQMRVLPLGPVDLPRQ